jgi:hypothetical protein
MLGIAVAPPGARFHGTLPRYGAPVHVADYADGFKQCAYSVQEDPTIGADAGRVYFSWQYDKDRSGWAQLALPDQPRPLYRPENLESHPEWVVYVFEREDMVDAFHTLSGDAEVIATTVPGGCTKFDRGEWEALYGRTVVLWPTNTKDSLQGMHDLGRRLQKGGSKVSVLQIPQDKPPGWSFLQVAEASWTWAQCEDFIRTQRLEAVAEVIPIRAARAHANSPAPVAEPRQVKQSPVQVQGYRDIWARIPHLMFAPNGTPYANAYNLQLAVQSIAGRVGGVWYDEFHCKVMTDTQNPRAWADTDTISLLMTLQGSLGFAAARERDVWSAIRATAEKERRHEVREWLQSLHWDQTTRLNRMLTIGWGTPDDDYYSAVGRNFIVSAVARIMQPGCQVDYVPVFEGSQGAGKTSSLRILFSDRWFDNPTALMKEKDFLQNMTGKWCLELGELANAHGTALELVKAIITRKVDVYRVAYGHLSGSFPRQCVFAGTVDRSDWNSDEAGGRRWWPVACGEIDLRWIEDSREQLFAEALERFELAESWHEVPTQQAAIERDARRERIGWFPLVERQVFGQTRVSFESVMYGIGLDKARDWTPPNERRVRLCLKRLGFVERADHTWQKF